MQTGEHALMVSLNLFFKIGVLKNFAIFTGKHLHWSIIYNKVAVLRLANLLKKRLQQRCFPANTAKFLRTTFLIDNTYAGCFR